MEEVPYHQCKTATVYDPAIFCIAPGCGQISDIMVEEEKLILRNRQTRERIQVEPIADNKHLEFVCVGIVDSRLFALDKGLTGYKTSLATFLTGAKSGSVQFERTALRLPATDFYSLLNL